AEMLCVRRLKRVELREERPSVRFKALREPRREPGELFGEAAREAARLFALSLHEAPLFAEEIAKALADRVELRGAIVFALAEAAEELLARLARALHQSLAGLKEGLAIARRSLPLLLKHRPEALVELGFEGGLAGRLALK